MRIICVFSMLFSLLAKSSNCQSCKKNSQLPDFCDWNILRSHKNFVAAANQRWHLFTCCQKPPQYTQKQLIYANICLDLSTLYEFPENHQNPLFIRGNCQKSSKINVYCDCVDIYSIKQLSGLQKFFDSLSFSCHGNILRSHNIFCRCSAAPDSFQMFS